MTPRQSLQYGFGHFGKSLFWYGGEMLFAFFLTEIVGVPAPTMGIVLALGLALSALLEPLLAWRMRARLARIERAGDLQWIGALASVAAVLTAALAAKFIPAPLNAACVIVALLVFRFAYAFYDLPQNALFGLLATQPDLRNRLATLRMCFSGLAVMTVTALAVPVAGAVREGSDAAAGFVWLTAGIGMVALYSAGRLRSLLRGGGFQTVAVADGFAGRLPRWRGDVLLWLALAALAPLATSAFSKLAPYIAAYALETRLGAGLMIIALSFGSVASQPVWLRVAQRGSLWLVVGAAALMLAGASLALPWLARGTMPVAMLAAAGLGAAGGGLSMAMWSGYAQALQSSPQRVAIGPAISVFTSTSKMALAVGMLLLGGMLQWVDYQHDGEALLWLAALWSAAGAGLSMLVLARHVMRRMFPEILAGR